MDKYPGGVAMAGAKVTYPLVAVAIDKDNGSLNALKWAIDHLMQKGQTLVLVHVNTKAPSGGQEDALGFKPATDPVMKEVFLCFKCFCTRKDIRFKEVVLDDKDICKGLIEFVSKAGIEKLVMGSTSKGGIRRLRMTDVPNSVSKGAPDFCTIYSISCYKDKVCFMREAVRAPPVVSPLREHMSNPSMPKSESSNSGIPQWTSQNETLEAEMRKLKMELKQTMEMYNNACKEAEVSRQQREEQKRQAEESLSDMQLLEREKAKALAAMEAAKAAQRIAEHESEKRMNAERMAQMAQHEAEERKKMMEPVKPNVMCRKYTIEEIEVATQTFDDNPKIGEGGYGPVFRGFLDHTAVADKDLLERLLTNNIHKKDSGLLGPKLCCCWPWNAF